MKITVFKYGECLYKERRIFSNVTGEQKIPMSFCFYLIQTEGKNILVDVGCNGLEHYNFYEYRKPVELLREYGLETTDITDVIVTHAHYDHVSEIYNYRHANIYVQNNEQKTKRFAEYFEGEYKVFGFNEEYTVAKDVLIKHYGGHTIGSCIVYAGKCLLCGDECYFQRNFTDRIRTGNSHDHEKSQYFVDHYGNTEYKPLLFHDAAILPGAVGYACVYSDEE